MEGKVIQHITDPIRRYSLRIELINLYCRIAAASLMRLEEEFLKEANIVKRRGHWKVNFQEHYNKNKEPKPRIQRVSFNTADSRAQANRRDKPHRDVFVVYDLKAGGFITDVGISLKQRNLSPTKLGTQSYTDPPTYMNNGHDHEQSTFRGLQDHDHSAFRGVQAEEIRQPVQATNDTVSDGGIDAVQHLMNGLQINGYHKEHYQLPLRTEAPIATSLSSASKDTSREPRAPASPNVQVPDRTNVRYPDYIDLHVREETFRFHEGSTNWPHDDSVQDKNVLASHGFFFTGRFDLCRCYQCGLGLKDWTSDDDILYVHLKYSPNCSHITRTVDPNMISVYRRSVQQSNVPVGAASNMPEAGSPTTMRHPEYERYQVRLASFNRWPSELMQTPEMLAESGFFHTGLRDVVRCYFCDGGLQRWDAGDQPWIEHARWFPTCTHVVREKGEEYIRLVQAATEYSTDEEYPETNSEIPVDSVYPIFSEAAKQVTELGFSKSAVTMAIDECRSNNLPLTADNMMNVLLDKQDRGEELPTDEPAPIAPPMPQFNESTKQGLLEEREYLRSRLLCIQCVDRECNTLFLPCGHHKMCTECAHSVETCPICSKRILQKVKTYMS